MPHNVSGADAGGISVIVPTYNGANRLPALLDSLRLQDVDQSRLEIIIVDDDSTDGTVGIAAKYRCRVLRNGSKSPERGKAIGLECATHELVLFIDDDNRLTDRSWLTKAIAKLRKWPNAVGVQSCRFTHRNTDSLVNRWAAIYGVGDPVVFYLGRRDHLTQSEEYWALVGDVQQEDPESWFVRFTPERFPTLGSQGFLTRRSLQLPAIVDGYWLHIDANCNLTAAGNDSFVFLKSDVVHEYCDSVSGLIKKLRRNIRFYLSAKRSRSYKWGDSGPSVTRAAISMVTIVLPLVQAVREFQKTRDAACFLHVYLCLLIPCVYGYEMLMHRTRKLWPGGFK